MKLRNSVLFFFTATLAILIVYYSESVLQTAKQTLQLCANTLIPSLFPFMIIGNISAYAQGGKVLGKYLHPFTSKFFKINGSCSLPLISGIISGYPVGAKVTAEMVKKGELSIEDGNRLLGFCNNPGPMFITGTVASMLGCNMTVGIILWTSQLAAAFLTGIILCKSSPYVYKPENPEPYPSVSENIVFSVKNAVQSILSVCGFVIFFATVLNILENLHIHQFISKITFLDTKTSKALISGAFEAVSGSICASSLPLPLHLKLPFVSMLLGWSGMCVHMQVASAISGSGLSLNYYLKGKLYQTVLAPVFTFLLLKIVPTVTTVSFVTTTSLQIKLFAWTFMIILILCSCTAIFFSVFLPNMSKAKK